MSDLCGSGGYAEVDGHETNVVGLNSYYVHFAPLGFIPKDIKKIRIDFYSVRVGSPSSIYNTAEAFVSASQNLKISDSIPLEFGFSRVGFKDTASPQNLWLSLLYNPSLNRIDIASHPAYQPYLSFRIYEVK